MAQPREQQSPCKVSINAAECVCARARALSASVSRAAEHRIGMFRPGCPSRRVQTLWWLEECGLKTYFKRGRIVRPHRYRAALHCNSAPLYRADLCIPESASISRTLCILTKHRCTCTWDAGDFQKSTEPTEFFDPLFPETLLLPLVRLLIVSAVCVRVLCVRVCVFVCVCVPLCVRVSVAAGVSLYCTSLIRKTNASIQAPFHTYYVQDAV